MKKFEELLFSLAKASEEDNSDAAQRARLQVLALCAEESLRNPEPIVLLQNEAGELEDKGEWAAAEAAHRRALELCMSSGHFGRIAHAQIHLARLFGSAGRLRESVEMAQVASASARASEINVVIILALLAEGDCLFTAGHPEQELAVASEALQRIGPEKMHALTRAQAHISRARALLACAEARDAATELDAAEKWHRVQLGGETLPGVMWSVANWWEVKSDLAEEQGHLAEALAAIKQTIERRRQFPRGRNRLLLARALEQLASLAAADGDPAEKERALLEASSIRRSLHLPAAP